MSEKVLYIRADMNSQISVGHVMRCLSVADSAKARGIKTVFIAADDNPVPLVKERGHEIIVLGTDWQDMESELPALEKIIAERGIDRILIDTYQVTDAYLRRVNELARVYYLDDVNAFPYPVYAVINYSNHADESTYPVRYPGTKFYLGCGYAPLRKAFKDPHPKKINPSVKNILIMSGGSDPYDMLPQILDALPLKDFETVNAICGNFNNRLDSLKAKYASYPSVHILPSVEKIWRYYEEADVAISAGGSTLYELSSMGVPTITYSFVDNQIPNVRAFDLDGVMPYAGDARGGNVPARVRKLLEEMDDASVRSENSRRLQRLVDGQGADRMVDVLCERPLAN
ncbi:MAG: UDP-2,4-diacetamido-2,4,6-trideoxy-beta-L-altropyranose hydrolase [Lachnospiraceae bacterium]|nr:UDP-2,4-diacetamido-2,4,6-trideoxy-beta-L-altropyranose hydrolase [Clostridiales bacterium]MBP3753251.1 UDP-2,4-diacetamido-2,4,6-trideoxy-beta-L-altropyranose hydrolase [Lachnospiraceae bacterium]